MRLRRTLVWCRGNDTEKYKAALEGSVDVIVLDIEDGVVVSEKAEARACIAKALKERPQGCKEHAVRINAPGSPFYELDMEAILPGIPDSIRLPKCETPEYVLAVSDRLAAFEDANGLERNRIELILMIETPLGIMHAYELATCTDRVTAIGIGMEDLTGAIGVPRYYEINSHDMMYAKQKLVLEAKAAGVQALDSGTLFLGRLDYMAEDSVFSRRTGFDGRSIKDVAQADVVNAAFTPSENEVAWAKKITDAYKAAVAAGQSDLYVDDSFIDPPVILKANTILERMRKITELVNERKTKQ